MLTFRTHCAQNAKTYRYSWLLILFSLLFWPAPAHAQDNQGATLFLPIVAGANGAAGGGGDDNSHGGSEGPSSLQLIEQDRQIGQLSAEQALIYQVQAVVNDPNLPAQYRGADQGLDGSTVFAQAVAQFDTLSADAQAQLRPYLLPPAAAESWFAGQSATAAGSAAASEWDTVATANGKVKVWYRTAVASHAARAVAIADAINKTIWPQLTGLMREPLPDCGASCSTGGGDDRIDIYLVNVRRNYSQPFTCCNGSSGFAVIRPDTSFAYVARTMMYLIEYAYPMASLDEYRWLMHASAQYAMQYVYPNDNHDPDYPARNQEHAKAGDFLYRTLYPLETVDDGHEFGAYLLFYWIDDPSAVADAWAAATNPNSLAVVNDQINDGFAWGWPRFSVDNWNQEPVDYYKRQDELAIGPEPVEDFEISEAGTEEFVIDIPHLTSYYFRFTFPDRSLKRIAVFNPIAGAGEPTGAMWAIMKIDGTWRTPQDWSSYSHQIFCRDEPNQNLEELILVLSNSEWQDRDHSVVTDYGSVRVTPDCGGLLSGTFTLHYTAHNELPSGSRGNVDQTTVVNVNLRYDDEMEEYVDNGSTFSHSSTVYNEAHDATTGELGYIMRWTESGSGDFNQDGTQIKGSVNFSDTEEDSTWVGAKIRYRQTGETVYYPSGYTVPIDGEQLLTIQCNDPTGVRGVRNENGVFDLTCRAEWSNDTGGGVTTVSGTLALQ